jgi:hypothetical protein
MTEVRVLSPGESTVIRAASGADSLFENLGIRSAPFEAVPV